MVRRASKVPVIALSAALLVASGRTPSLAASIATNGSFENTAGFVPDVNDTMSLTNGSTVMTGWTVIGDSLAWIGPSNTFLLSAFDGGYFLDLTDYTAGPPFGGVRQVLNTVAGDTYQVTFDLGSSNRWGGQSGLQASAGSTTASFLSTTTPGTSTWESESFSFLATGPTTTLSFLGSLGVNYIGLDNISVTDLGGSVTGVPEPTTWGLMIVGLSLVGVGMRKRQKAIVRYAV